MRVKLYAIIRHVCSTTCLLVFCFYASNSHASEAIRQRLEAWKAGYPSIIANREIQQSQAIIDFYQMGNFSSLWFANEKLSQQAKDLINVINTITTEGLLPEDYHSAFLNRWFSESSSIELSEFELLLTDAFLTLVKHLDGGKVLPTSLSDEWQPKEHYVDFFALLMRVRNGTEINTILHDFRPNQLRYSRMKASLEYLRNLPKQDWHNIPIAPAIKQGTTDERLVTIRERLAFWGDLDNHQTPLNDDTDTNRATYYDDALRVAVEKFQYRHGLEMDGIMGRETLKAFNVTVDDRIKELIVNLERWRWLDQDFGDYFLVVNIAAFNLRVFSNNDVIFSTPVIVGRNARKSPVFSNTIRYLVLNPTWTVPHKLAVIDKLPIIKDNINYLTDMGFTVYKIGTTEAVDPHTIDWQSLSKRYFPYRLVQKPGPLNALGQIKFMFPNPYDVYLHDTPSRELFDKNERAFSSGCIRIANPIGLAELLLAPQGWDKDKINDVLNSSEITTVQLKKTVPVHLEYWTAWVDKLNRLNFRNDIYQRDLSLWQALNTPLQ